LTGEEEGAPAVSPGCAGCPALLDDAEGKSQPITVSTVYDDIQTVLNFPARQARIQSRPLALMTITTR
jgi:hypothetical protein